MKTVIYLSCAPVDCPKTTDILVCVSNTLTANGAPFITGQITKVLRNRGACGDVIYNSYVEYDETQLLNQSYSLISSDIQGFVCDPCLISIIDWKIQQAVPH
jgi:hypothetical protein